MQTKGSNASPAASKLFCLHFKWFHLLIYFSSTEVAYCTAFGEPHIITFDGVNYDYRENCRYVLAETCTSAEGTVAARGLNSFRVIQEIEEGKVKAVCIYLKDAPNAAYDLVRFLFSVVFQNSLN